LPSSISDHEAGVSFTIRAINASTMGSSYWKLNASLLKRPGYKKFIESTINDFSSARDAYPDVKSWWESLKYAIHIVTQPYAKEQNGAQLSLLKGNFCQLTKTFVPLHYLAPN
jgi:hypothetical protein